MSSPHPKVHSAAVAVVPPIHVWQPIQAIRCFRDKSFVRWPPHINLLYPFLEGASEPISNTPASGSPGGPKRESFRQLALRASRALSLVPPFRVRLEHLRTFRHSARSYTVWAAPVTIPGTRGTRGGGSGCSPGEEGLVEVQRLLEAEFPECRDLSRDEGRGIDGFVPHLSLGQLRDERDVQALQAAWTPLEFTVDSVQLISRRGYLSPFSIRYHVPLGRDLEVAGESALEVPLEAARSAGEEGPYSRPLMPARLDVPYVATMANLTAGGGGGGSGCREGPGGRRWGSGGAGGAGGQVARFASPALILPLPPSEADEPSEGMRAGATAAGPPGAGGGVGEGTSGASRDAGGSNSAGSSSRKRRSSHAGEAGAGRAVWMASEPGAGCVLGGGPAEGVTAAVAAPATAEGADEGAATESSQLLAVRRNAAAGDGEEEAAATKYRDRAGGSAGGSHVDGGGDYESGGEGGGSQESAGGASVWWFAYGAAAGVAAAELGAAEALPALAAGYRLAFTRRGGRANIIPLTQPEQRQQHQQGAGSSAGEGAGSKHTAADSAPSEVAGPGAHGALFRLPVDRMARLLLAVSDASPVEVLCHPYGGSDAVAAVAFAVPPQDCEAQDAVPSAGYMAALQRACEPHGISLEFREWLAAAAANQPPWDGRASPGGAQSNEGDSGSGGGGGGGGGGAGRRGAARRGAFRTGAKKAVAGLPRATLDW